MAARTEVQNVTYNGKTYACTVKHVILANGKAGVSWLHSARDTDGPVADEQTLDRLRIILGVA